MYNPLSTYRIQFNKDFRFSDAAAIIPYLKKLGVKTLYASPIFKAAKGSMHGYDVVDPNQINPEVGSLEEFKQLAGKLQQEGIGWVQDIVPNHMAFDQDNKWLWDYLEKGTQSKYHDFFDVPGTCSLFQGKMMVPFLGNSLDEVVANNEISLVLQDGRFHFQYFETLYPVNAESYQLILKGLELPPKLNQALEQLQSAESKNFDAACQSFYKQFKTFLDDEAIATALQQLVESINNKRQQIQELLNQQHYRLCHWQETDTQINFRRFFTVNGLICLRIQSPNVFDEHHKLVKQLVDEGWFQGLRIDHIDGLYNPTGYLERLRKLAGDNCYIIVEKILEHQEKLPQDWPVEGTSGYDFLADLNNLFTNRHAEESFCNLYQEWADSFESTDQLVFEKKHMILQNHMAGELDNLYHYLLALNIIDKKQLAKMPSADLKGAVADFLVFCPVYRFYPNRFPLSPGEAKHLEQLFAVQKKHSQNTEAVNILMSLFLHRPHEGNEALNSNIAKFFLRCMQFTGPLMAKGVEDTLMYTYHRFIAHNEVGDTPNAFGISNEDFHNKMQDRQLQWPLAMNATATHDTKRGEDVRARLNVLSDIQEDWQAQVKEWREMNQPLRQQNGPDDNDEYFLYQVLVGHYPFKPSELENFRNRLGEYLQKALREGKTNSNWSEPDEEYEEAIKSFASKLLQQNAPFSTSLQSFIKQLTDHAIINSLSQIVLKAACPGVTDVYQGCEYWDLSFVDPDNRRPVDFTLRSAKLSEFENIPTGELLDDLWKNRESGDIKFWLLQKMLQLRQEYEQLFSSGDYLPIPVEGFYKENIFAFARRQEGVLLIFILPLHTAAICKEQECEFFEIDWKDTKIRLPHDVSIEARLLTTSEQTEKISLEPGDLFKLFPVAIVKARQAVGERGAGILLHISSLPSVYGIGDMGNEARQFADLLHHNKQKYWQLLPLNPTEAGQGHSPYSALSSKAGNPLLISPDLLAKDNLLDKNEIDNYHLPESGKVDFESVLQNKTALLQKAFESFNRQQNSALQPGFQAFLKNEKDWLDDFALFMLLKQNNKGAPWYQWPDTYKNRNIAALNQLASAHAEEIEKIKWIQFVFSRQWQELRAYCNKRSIKLIGDVPYYVSYDSVDVWANQELFALDEEGKPTGKAGVPPDAFSNTGQLWGMPVFNWQAMKVNHYKWWAGRLKKNMEQFDLVRLDHFRAFAAYWQVPANDDTAMNGNWQPGPGADFFKAMEKQLGKLPFIAEDLGDIDQDVLDLRDALKMPGMKVLQFAFGDDMPVSGYIPHNYEKNFVVYTGTHDNNTTVGWYKTEADDEIKSRLSTYLSSEVSADNIHRLLARQAYASVANIVILPMQDVLGLDESARMNIPSSAHNNWSWKLTAQQLKEADTGFLEEWASLFNRD